MKLQLNGETTETSAATVSALIVEHGLDPAVPGIAVAVNGSVVPRARWGGHILAEGDEVELITAMQGG